MQTIHLWFYWFCRYLSCWMRRRMALDWWTLFYAGRRTDLFWYHIDETRGFRCSYDSWIFERTPAGRWYTWGKRLYDLSFLRKKNRKTSEAAWCIFSFWSSFCRRTLGQRWSPRDHKIHNLPSWYQIQWRTYWFKTGTCQRKNERTWCQCIFLILSSWYCMAF